MNKVDFHIVALPKSEDLRKLNDLRNYFYSNSFRFSNEPTKSDTHITLAQGSCNKTQIPDLKERIMRELTTCKPFNISYTRVTKDERMPVAGKCNFSSYWIALLFDDKNLKRLGKEIDTILKEKGMSTTAEYISKILSDLHKGQKLQKEVIANHINLCNYCRPEKADEAVELIVKSVTKEITIDRIAFRRTDASLSWIIDI